MSSLTTVNRENSELAAPSLDGRLPDVVLRPTREEEAVEAVLRAAREGMALVPWGGGTAIRTGNRLRAERWAILDTAGLTDVLDYSPDDMVVTVGAGTTLRTLQALLAKHNQFLPIDPPHADRATMGGITATNAQGLLRPSYALPRDRLLGARIVLSDGSVARAGSKVVKNVAGYDLCKLVAGSWGTLGLITEVTYKTNPIPAARMLLQFTGEDTGALCAAALEIHAARLQPAYLVVTGPEAPALHVGLMGSEGAVAWQAGEISARLGALGLQGGEAHVSEEETLHSFVADRPAEVSARIAVRPTDTIAALKALESYAAAYVCHVAVGVIEVAFSEMSLPGDDVYDAPPAWWADRVQAQLPGGAHLVWPRVPDSWKVGMDVWGPTRPDFRLIRGLKEAFDPLGLFSPGRFVGRM